MARQARVIDPEVARRMEEMAARAERRERVRVCFEGANVPARYREARLEQGDQAYAHLPADGRDKYRDASRRLGRAFNEPGIYALIGEIGDGKTHLACALVNAFCQAGRSAKYLDAADYIGGIRSTWRAGDAVGGEERFLQRHVSFALLVIDELTLRRDTPDENVIIGRLLKKRDDERRTTVVIGNYASKSAFEEAIDARVADRIIGGGGVIFCDWPSLRGRIDKGVVS